MKKSLKLVLAGAVLCGGISTAVFSGNEQTADEAKARLEKLVDLFKDRGLNSFNFLNGLDQAGITKNRNNLDGTEYADLRFTDDGKGTIICIENGKYAVNQLKPTLVGEDSTSGANIWYGGVGHQMTPKIVKALSESPDGWASVHDIERTSVNNPREGLPNEEITEWLAVRSDVLLGKKNDTGKKFFCAVRYRPIDGTDWQDSGSFGDRMSPPDGHGRPHHHHKHHRHHHKKHEAAPMLREDKEGPSEAAAAA